MNVLVVAMSALALLHPASPRSADDRAGFVTVLGRDTVALESFTRTASRLEGDIVVRVPGTVLFHYVLHLEHDGTVSRSVLDMTPLGVPHFTPYRVTIELAADSARVRIDSAGATRRETHPITRGSPLLFTTGFGASYGLYASLGMYEYLLSRLHLRPGDSTTVGSVSVTSGRTVVRHLIRRSPTSVDVDFFKIAWTHFTTDTTGHIVSVDASETTEQTRSTRTEFFDVPKAARAFADRDRRGAGLGPASPDTLVRASVGGATIAVEYGSPRRRERTILGHVVPYGTVWRTGANRATFFVTDRDLVIGGRHVPAGMYSLWTLPTEHGVELIINRQYGQWGTHYDPSKDLARIPMTVATAPRPRENFAIELAGDGSSAELRIAWDTFIWSVPVVVK